MTQLASAVADLLTVFQTMAALDPEEEQEVPLPRAGASVEAVEHAQRERGVTFDGAYADFLRLHDGWPDFPWGMQLFGTEELTGGAYDWADEVRGYAREADEDIPAALMEATIIGKSDQAG